MSTVYFITFILTLSSAFTILLIGKLGIRDNVIAKAPKLISQLFDCDFCLSFWVSLILAVILAIIFSDLSIIFIPILSAPITRVFI